MALFSSNTTIWGCDFTPSDQDDLLPPVQLDPLPHVPG